jgi:mannose-6-phosphate isomerase-like protein (cupin superfamily)
MYATFSQSAMPTGTPAIRAGAGERLAFRGMRTRVVATPRDTGGAFLALLEHDLDPRALGAPVHTHTREDEITHVVHGRLGVELGGEVIVAGPGDTVVKPRRVPHAFWNAGDEPLRVLQLVTPPGLESYFAEVLPLSGGRGLPPDPRGMRGVARRYGLDLDVASAGRLAAEHGLVAA